MTLAHRPMFLHIGHTWLFYVIAAVATLAFLGGLALYVALWRKIDKEGRIPISWYGVKRVLVDAVIGKRLFYGEAAAGLMHLLIFWGFSILFLGTILLSVHHYVAEFLVGGPYLLFSFAMEIAGLMLAVGLLWAVVRRYVQHVPRLEKAMEDSLVLVWLLAVVISGFIVESLRIASQGPMWRNWSFIGNFLSALFSAGTATSVYPYLWWIHAALSLGLIAIIPFTKLFHILGAPASVYLQAASEAGDKLNEKGENRFELKDLVFFDACMRCGRCVDACPSAGAGEAFAPREFVQAIRKSLWKDNSPIGDVRMLYGKVGGATEEMLWYCTTCRACLEVCPIYGPTFEEVIQKRAEAIEEGTRVPQLLIQTLEKLYRYNNPWESSKKKRAQWAQDLNLVDITKTKEEMELCYFVGCTTSFDTRAQEIGRSLARIFEMAELRFGILGKKEPCCGDIARRVGEFGLFMEQMEGCSKVFEAYEIKEIVTSSPHCFHTFRNDYSEATFRARHYSMVLDELIKTGRVRPARVSDLKVTYHDPCYLGRHNRIFEEPRRVIRAIPGIELREMVHHGPDSLCCGGGGGRMWQEELDGELKMSEIRIQEAYATGADVLITACPLCLIMLEDARKTQGLEERIRVMDLSEVLLMSLTQK